MLTEGPLGYAVDHDAEGNILVVFSTPMAGEVFSLKLPAVDAVQLAHWVLFHDTLLAQAAAALP